jgi:hypothetical protein
VDSQIRVDGDDSFVLGSDSYTLPGKLGPGEYVESMNTINRGGLLQTRPGSWSLFDMPSGVLQGCTLFVPSTGVPHLVFAVNGTVYASPYPFSSYSALPSIKFGSDSPFVSWVSCVQSTDYTDGGKIYPLDTPRPILIMQDGKTRAAYWDGFASGHIDPTPSRQEFTKPGKDGTVIGLWSVWSNNRLWVSCGNRVIPSDLGNPLKFTESQFLAEGRAFYLPGECTGIVETADREGIVCFTADTGTYIRSSIQDRAEWLSTPGFQRTILPGIGCIAPRSIVQQYGLIWWFTSKGLISQNEAVQMNVSSKMDIQDNEMFSSKYNLSHDLSIVAGCHLENFLLHAVPNGHRLNTRIHVLDQAPFEGGANSWASFWTGWRPVEFARGIVVGRERVFCCSYDHDGVNRMWELFTPDKTDNGIPITSYVLTRQHFFGSRDYKRFKYAELELQGLVGSTSVMAAIAGMRGAFQPVLRKEINAVHGQIYPDASYGPNSNRIGGSASQSRILRSVDSPAASECNAAGVESDINGLVDKAFSLLVVWSGIAGISAYRIFALTEPSAFDGICERDETDDERLLTPGGCGVLGVFSQSSPFERFSAEATFTKVHPVTGEPVIKTFTQTSVISQADAQRKAERCAKWYVLKQLGEIV